MNTGGERGVPALKQSLYFCFDLPVGAASDMYSIFTCRSSGRCHVYSGQPVKNVPPRPQAAGGGAETGYGDDDGGGGGGGVTPWSPRAADGEVEMFERWSYEELEHEVTRR